MNQTTADIIFEKAKAGYPAIYVHSSEDLRTRREIKDAAKKLDRTLYEWTNGKGVMQDGVNKIMPDTDGPMAACDYFTKIPAKSIYVLRLFHHFLDDPGIQARIIDAIPAYKSSGRTLIIVTPVLKLPVELEKEFALVQSNLPDKEVLDTVLTGITSGSKMKDEDIPTGALRKELIESALGLTSGEAENAFALALVRPKLEKSSERWAPSVVLEEKCQALKKTGLLEYIGTSSNLSQVGGMEALKAWIGKRKKAFTEEARKFGLPSPKGILVVGPPGGGKSLGAKAMSGELGLPLIRCDMGRLFGGLVGQSESNTRMAIQVAEAVSPCILWLDEVEKGFAGSSAGALDSGVGARVLGTFLTWMQEKETPVFVYATANDIASLPPELLRKGRFDELFSVLLPDEQERQEIIKIHVTKRSSTEHNRVKLINNGKPNGIDLIRFSELTDGFSGAEIEAAIVEALNNAFADGKDLNGMDLEDAIKATNPLSQTMAEKLEAMKEWCKHRTRAANPRNAVKTQVQEVSVGRKVDA